MSRLKDSAVALGVLLLGRRRRPRGGDRPRTVRPGPESRRAETAVILLFLAAALLAVGFVVVYALDGLPAHTQLYGVTLGGALVLLGAAGIVIGSRLVVTEELAESYPVHDHPEEQEAVADIVEQSDSRLTRKRLLVASGGTAAGALGLAMVTPAVSFGPAFNMDPLYRSRWAHGRRLVDERGRPYRVSDVEERVFYTAFPEHANRDAIWAPLVVVRLAESELALPPARAHWAPSGIVAYSKICTHAGCAISLYRSPTFPPVEAKPALVCPCHYSTFDPATGGTVEFGPAGRRLPQLPLYADASGYLRARGNFSGPVGPSWWGVRMQGPKA